ncbi:hypothetical protein [Methanobacterium sp.]|uniref:hypothetical protein n=1 Tax=Methanobacterium sp. TaxID=2164 RepID=UPI002AB84834|nr:hypothetical protein [Methanobacterium sp.]MDY9923174.1 hypothetical protein [Methanobacterium sp.]
MFISPNGNDTDGDGSDIKPYQTIHKGLETANNNTGTIYLLSGTYNTTGDYGLTVNKSLNIIGSGQDNTIIDAGNQNHIFVIQNWATVNILQITLRNGSGSYGGSILNRGNLTVEDCTFTGNRASNAGSAIMNWYGTLQVTSCTFTDNTAHIPNHAYGGAIANTGTSTIIDSTFNSNKAYEGGAVFNYLGNCTINNSNFQGNTAGKGGAIYNKEGILTLDNSTLEFNTATATSTTVDVVAAGAGIYNDDDSTMTIDNCIIQNNCATVSGDGVNVSAAGGGICNGGNLLIDNSIIQNNCAIAAAISQLNIVSADGGGIYNDNVLIMNNSIIQNNTVTANADKDVIANGAGIFSNGDMAINKSRIQYNTLIITTNAGVGAYGGGIQNGGNLYINDSILQYNTVTATTSGINRIGGGAISNTFAGNLYIDKSTIGYNTVAAIEGDEFAVGGGIYNENVLVISNSTIAFNTVTASNGGEYAPLGGGVCNFGEMVANFNRIVNNSPGAVHNDAESVPDLRYNWWGSSNPEFDQIITGTSADYDPWLVMRYTTNPITITQGSTSTLTADFRYDSDGTFHDPALGHLPDGTVVTFTTNLGNVGSKIATALTIDGVSTILLRGDEAAGAALTSAALDLETRYLTVPITPATVNAASTINAKIVNMQNTGIPLVGIALAILMVIGGFISTRKNQ